MFTIVGDYQLGCIFSIIYNLQYTIYNINNRNKLSLTRERCYFGKIKKDKCRVGHTICDIQL